MAPQIVEWRSAPSVYRFFLNPHQLTIEEHLNWYHNQYLANDRLISWIGFLKEDDEAAIGAFQIVFIDDETVEIGTLLDTDYQGKGYAVEATLAIETWLKCKKGISYTQAEIHKDNVDSIRYIQRLGYDRVDEFELFRKKL